MTFFLIQTNALNISKIKKLKKGSEKKSIERKVS